MVLQKRLDYGFNGYQVPAMPRATRSVRKRSSIRKKVDDNKMFAFDLLATVAGKLLLEGEISPTSSNNSVKENCSKHAPKKEEDDDDKPMKVEPCDRGSCERNFFPSEVGSQACDQEDNLNEFPLAYAITNPDRSEKVVLDKVKTIVNKIEVGEESYDTKLVDETKVLVKAEQLTSRKGVLVGNGSEMLRLGDLPEVHDRKPTALMSSDSSIKVPLCRDHHISHGSFSPCRNDVIVVSRDDDENSSGCTQPSSSTTKVFRAPPRLADRRIRKFLASKYWKVAPKLKDEELSNTDGELKHAYRFRKNSYKRQRSQRSYPFKKRKFFHRTSVSNSDGGITSGGISNFFEKGITGDASNLGKMMHGATRISSSTGGGQHTSIQSRDSHVKLRIKSFRVPELFIEIPETATVGSLKRSVMEAVTAILGGGLRIGVLLQGKKVRDDNKTLLQTGIAHNNPPDTLGFTLEPNSSQPSPALHQEDSSFLLPCDSPQPLTRYHPSSDVVQGSSNGSGDVQMPNLSNLIESDHDSAPSPTDMSIDKGATESKALISVPGMGMEALNVAPLHRKPKQSDLGQRRIRRPFSVSEVEALVQAVEKLGTGRWRDVKLRAFDNAKHRTYVDLKDKWKTLVHTARISPQQRRGEPVPQELLDRVLAAHAYWSHQQAKQQVKPLPETFLLH